MTTICSNIFSVLYDLEKKTNKRHKKIVAKMAKKQRQKDQFNYVVSNPWTNLRTNTTSSSIGRNWTTYYCIKYRFGYFDANVMTTINEFLNWIPAGCWNKKDSIYFAASITKKCKICGIAFVDKLAHSIEYGVCSFRCLEEEERKKIEEDYYMDILEMEYEVYSNLEIIQNEKRRVTSYSISPYGEYDYDYYDDYCFPSYSYCPGDYDFFD
jgi:hypothetical protein